MRRYFAILGSLVLVLAMLAPETALAQRRTLFDLLFGNGDQGQKQQPQQPTDLLPDQQRSAPAAPADQVRVVSSASQVEKSENATRLMVFGDVMATNLATALQRNFAQDPNIVILSKGVGASGFVRNDYYDWQAGLKEEITKNSFDVAVIDIGSNDRQPINGAQPLTDEWKQAYLDRLNEFLGQLRLAGKPVVWVGLPPMRSESYSQAMSEISSQHRLAALSNGAEFVDIYDRFVDDAGNYVETGPDLNGQTVQVRRDDGIHFTRDGADKVAYYVSQALKVYYRGGSVTVDLADPLEGTDAQQMVRLPFQGSGQTRLLEVAGAVLPLSSDPTRAAELVSAASGNKAAPSFRLEDVVDAPVGRADAFGVGIKPDIESDAPPPGK